jgi:DNA-binding transcriptional LysR family regulator
MLLTQLTYFEALARERHFGRAAASCYVSTSTLSEAIRKLEAEVGFSLVNRGKSAFQGITEEGEVVLAYARRILSEQRSLARDLAHRRGSLEGTVRFGTIPSGTDRAAEIVSHLVTAHPGLHIDLVAGLTSDEIVNRVRDHDFDAGVVHPHGRWAAERATGRSAQDQGLTLTPLGTARFVVVGQPELLAGAGDRITGRQLASLPVALLARGMVAREEFDRAMASAGIDVTPGAESTSVESLLALAGTGTWVVVVPAPAAGTAHLTSLPLVDPDVCLELALVRRDSRPAPVLSTAFEEAAAAVMP